MEVRQEEQLVIIDSLRAIYKMKSPVTGFLLEVNREFEDCLEKINTDPMGEGWVLKIDVKSIYELNELMNEREYDDYVLNNGRL